MAKGTRSLNAHRRWMALTGCFLPMVAARSGLRLWGCPVRHLTGIPCPTCGMTRSLSAIAQGQWQRAVELNLLGPVLFGLLLLGSGCLLLELGLDRRVFDWGRLRSRFVWGGAIGLGLGYHAVRLYHLQQTGELAIAVHRSPLGQLLF